MIARRLPSASPATVLPLLLAAAVACGGSADRGAEGAARDSAAAPAAAPATTDSAAPAGTPSADPAAPAAQASGALLDPNDATREQLLAVPGMTAPVADALIAGRPYADMRAVNRVLVAQVPDSTARKGIYARVWKPIDINAASGEEILLIPGVGRRMRHEFEEYRPYRSVEQFRREIGKYVDRDELARLERYVAIR